MFVYVVHQPKEITPSIFSNPIGAYNAARELIDQRNAWAEKRKPEGCEVAYTFYGEELVKNFHALDETTLAELIGDNDQLHLYKILVDNKLEERQQVEAIVDMVRVK